MKISPKTGGRPLILKNKYLVIYGVVIALMAIFYFFEALGSGNPFHRNSSELIKNGRDTTIGNKDSSLLNLRPTVLDSVKYDQLLRALNNGDSSGHWPVKYGYPLPGAIFPFNRVVAYYGNFYSKKMGVLGSIQPIQCSPNLKKK